MGQELECKMRYQRRTLAGKAHLETDYILFRGDERLKIGLKDLKSVRARDGVLRLEFDGGPADLELGRAAEKWADKILHPPSRLDKLGVKPGVSVRLVGAFDGNFKRELDEARARVLKSGSKASLILFAADTRADLEIVFKLATQMEPKGALWVIYPKGVTAIREMEVLEAGRAAGLKDNKVASFSPTHTGLKFVIPVAVHRGPVIP
jgi:hypothetical protein